MRDRGGAEYHIIKHPVRYYRDPVTPSHVIKVQHVTCISPTRQREKASGLSGRQLIRARKVNRAFAKARS